jgi:dTDP-4-dehydrorhamnose 3,5-epimerase
MRFSSTTLNDAFLVTLEPAHDNRGFFARSFSVEEFMCRGLETNYPQHSVSYTARAGTLRGMHYQAEPASEAKLVRCTRGAVHDVIVDIRPQSPTYRMHQAFTLSAENRDQLYIPKGFAHGFQTLSDDVEMSYLISAPYQPELARGFRYDDPTFAIYWPMSVTVISEKDLSWPRFLDTTAYEKDC